MVQILQPVEKTISPLTARATSTLALTALVTGTMSEQMRRGNNTELMIESLPRATKHIKISYLVDKTHASHDLNLEGSDPIRKLSGS